MHYDITAKALLELDAMSILRRLVGLDVGNARLLELKQEFLSVKVADAPFLIELTGNKKHRKSILLLEWQSRWVEEKLLSLISYRTALRSKFHIPVETVMILLTPSRKAVPYYSDSEMRFSFKLVKLWELKARDWIHSPSAVLPFVPLMKGGIQCLDEIEKAIYDSNESRDVKATLITATFVLTGLKDKAAAKEILKRWRGIMIESPAYEMIKAEGRKEERRESKAKWQAEGEYKKALATARAMLREGLAYDLIARVTGLSVEEIEKL